MNGTRGVLAALVFVGWATLSMWAQTVPAQAGGVVTDPQGHAISGATVVLAPTSGAPLTTSSDATGAWKLNNIAPASYALRVSAAGFKTMKRQIVLHSGQRGEFNSTLVIAGVQQVVQVHAAVKRTSETVATITRDQIQVAAGPAASAAAALTTAPGVSAYGYGGISGTSRYTFVVRGMKAGWASVTGDLENHGISFLLDGVPMNNLIDSAGQWEADELPIMEMFSNVHLTYGPGNPRGRWFDSLGGTVNFVPTQPGKEPYVSYSVAADYGSYATEGVNFGVRIGDYHDWSGILSGGRTSGNTFRTGTFKAPNSAYALYGKLRHPLPGGGSFSLGVYRSSANEFRPNFIPMDAIQGITTTGVGTSSPLYSQATSGFYGSLDQSIWNKKIGHQTTIEYARFRLPFTSRLRFNNTTWYRFGRRVHSRITNYVPNNPTNTELYNGYSNEFGDQVVLDWSLPRNAISYGGSWIHQAFHSPLSLYNPAMGTSEAVPFLFNAGELYNSYLTAFVQDRIQLLPNLFLTPGIEEEDYQTQFYNTAIRDFPVASAPGSNSGDLTNSPDAQKTFSKLAPSLGVQFIPLHALSFYGNYSTTYQNPINKAFGYISPSPVNLATLPPIKSTDYETGVRLLPCQGSTRLGYCSLSATYYHDTVSSETLGLFLPFPINQEVFSTGSSLLQGESLSFNESPHSANIQFHGNVNFSQAHFTHYIPSGSKTDYAGYPTSNSPRIQGNLGISSFLRFGNKYLTPDLWYQYVGSFYMFSNLLDAPSKQRMPGYGVVNLTLGAVIPFGRHSGLQGPLHFSIGAYNLFNLKYNPLAYISSGGYFGGNSTGAILVDPGAPREYYVSVHLGF